MTYCSQSYGALEEWSTVPRRRDSFLGEGGGDFGTLIEIRDAPGGALNSEDTEDEIPCASVLAINPAPRLQFGNHLRVDAEITPAGTPGQHLGRPKDDLYPGCRRHKRQTEFLYSGVEIYLGQFDCLLNICGLRPSFAQGRTELIQKL